MSRLTAAERRRHPDSDFALPDKREYPDYDHGHAVAALSEVEQHGTPTEEAKVRADVKRKFKDMTLSRKDRK